MQKAARLLVEEYGSVMPSEYEELRRLPGIGSYTAGAISSIACGKREPAVDGNVLRVLTRLKGDGRDISLQRVRTGIENEVRFAMPKDRPGDFNQALMELGATVCLPNGRPCCEECPCKEFCIAHFEQRETDYPYKTPKKPRTSLSSVSASPYTHCPSTQPVGSILPVNSAPAYRALLKPLDHL